MNKEDVVRSASRVVREEILFGAVRSTHHAARPPGQALVEVALIFPLFLILVFGLMQIGHLAAMTIIVNHAAFEVARIGAITAELPPPGQQVQCSNARVSRAKIHKVADQIFDKWPGKVVDPITTQLKPTLIDPEMARLNCDLVLTLQYEMPLIFPFVNVFFAQPPHGGYDPELGGPYRMLTGESRMPLEMPLW